MEKLSLGVAREIITPEIGAPLYGYRPDFFSTEVADDLTATAFYFRQGEREALMISLTVCELQTELTDRIRALIEEKTGIPRDNCILAAIHTHTGPNTSGGDGWGDIDMEYCESIFIPRILSVTEKAKKNVQHVTMGSAQGDSLVGINRRELTPENKIRLGQNPWAPFDPRMMVISFKNDDGEVVANIVHYGAHCTAAGVITTISRDWAGIMIDTLEEQSGGITAFFNGAEGDTGPRLTNGKTTGNMRFVRELGSVAAQDAVKIFRKIYDYREVDLSVSATNLEIPMKARVDLETAKKLLEQYKGETVNFQGMMRMQMEKAIASYEEGYEDIAATQVPQTVIGVGNIYFVALPYEFFSEIGMRIDGQFKDAAVLCLSNANGKGGYFITEDALCRGGYEVDMWIYQKIQSFVDNADWHLITQTVEHIKKCKGE